MIVKAALGFLTEAGDDRLIGDVQGAINGLTDNPNFPAPAPSNDNRDHCSYRVY